MNGSKLVNDRFYLIKNLDNMMTNSFKEIGSCILIIGKTLGHLYQSEFFREVMKIYEGSAPKINLFNEKSKNYRTQINLYASSYHYKLNSRYRVIVPGISTFIRTPDKKIQFWFKFSKNLPSFLWNNNKSIKILEGINIYSSGYIVAPPSFIRKNNLIGQYEIEEGKPPVEFPNEITFFKKVIFT